MFTSRNKYTPTEYINILRTDKAKELLLNSSMSMMEIAEHVGFNDSNYFANVFHKFCGISPSHFRKQNK